MDTLNDASQATVGMMVNTFDEGVERGEDDEIDIIGDAPVILAEVANEILSSEGLRELHRLIGVMLDV